MSLVVPAPGSVWARIPKERASVSIVADKLEQFSKNYSLKGVECAVTKEERENYVVRGLSTKLADPTTLHWGFE